MMNFKKALLVSAVSLSSISDMNAFKLVEYYHNESKCHYKAYCFSKEEAQKIKDAIDASKNVSSVIGIIPQAKPFTEIITRALAGLKLAVW